VIRAFAIRLTMKYLVNITAFALSLMCSHAFGDDRIVYEGIPFYRYQIPFYTFAEYTPQLALRMDYAQFEVDQDGIDEWVKISEKHTAYEVDLVFTLYPKDIKAWRTNYDELLRNRIFTLLAADTTLKAENIRWNMVLQTQCGTEDEAKRYFHGFVIKYRPKHIRIIEKVKSAADLKALVKGYARTRDSTVYNVMERNPNWEDMLVVMDWTGSMYKYGVQLVLWHKYLMGSRSSRVKHFVFFNDGNKRTTPQKAIGRTGGVYNAKTLDIDAIVETMVFVMEKGNGGDVPENDLEAVLTGTQYLEQFKSVILIADNKSSVRDLKLLEKVEYPIHVILCDVKDRIHPDYLDIAFKTGGSIHTLEKDLYRRQEALRCYELMKVD